MKILQVNKFYYLRRGAERYYFNLLKLLEDHGQQVIPFAMADVRNLPTEYQDYFTKHLDFGQFSYSWRSIKKVKDIIYNQDAQRDLAKLISRTNPEIVHLHNFYHQLSPSILPVFKHFKLPVVMTVHDFKLICPNYSLFTQGKPCERCKQRKYYQAIIHRCLKNSVLASSVVCLESYIHRWLKIYEKNIDLFIAPSHFVKNKLVEWGWPAVKIRVIPHFIPLGPKLPFKKPQNYILYFGGLESGKGLARVIKTWYSEKLDVDLHIAGEGQEKANLEKLVAKYNLQYQVKFLGQLNDQELQEEIRSCQLVIVPSLQYETFGLTVLEALALSKPVLVSTQGALPELIKGAVGQVFNPYQKGSLGQNIRALLANPNLEQMGKNGYQLVKEEYGPEDHYQQIIEVYNNLLADKK